MLIKRWKQLKKQGVLGINERNLHFIQALNKRKHYPLVDNKILTKSLALQYSITVPTLYHAIENEHQNKGLSSLLANLNSFVVKPAHGAGGEGITIITHTINNRYRLSNGRMTTLDDLRYHISNILSGTYSLGGQPDHAMIEYFIQFDPLFQSITYQGVPDIRIIVLKGYPIMAMARLPTRESNGKANLHQGAIGVGIDLKTGITTNGVWYNESIEHHPDTISPLAGLTIPHWKSFLKIAASCYEMTNLGYLGVDLVLDKKLGPLMLELNARPGLNIQIANTLGITKQYQQLIKSIDLNQSQTPNQRIKIIAPELYHDAETPLTSPQAIKRTLPVH